MTNATTDEVIAKLSENPSHGELAIAADAYRRVHAVGRQGSPRDAVRRIPDPILLWLFDRCFQREFPADATDGQRCDFVAEKLVDVVIVLDSLEEPAAG